MADPRGTVLLVEDDDSLRQIVARHLRAQRLQRHEAAVCGVCSGARLTTASRPDVVLLDVNLPGDTGWDLLRSPALAGRRLATSRDHERRQRQPQATGRVPLRRLAAQTVSAGDAG